MSNTRMLRVSRQLLDLTVLAVAYVLAFWFRYDRRIPPDVMRQIAVTLPYVVGLKYLVLGTLQVHRHSWRYTSLPEVVRIVRAMLAVAFVLGAFRIVAPTVAETLSWARYAAIPYIAIAVDFLLATFGLIGVRTLRRVLSEAYESRGRPTGSGPAKRVLLIGAGRAGVMVARELAGRPDLNLVPIGFVDDDPHKRGQLIYGLPVLGSTTTIPDIVGEQEPDEAIITMASAEGAVVRRILEICKDARLDTKIIPGIYELVGGQVNLSRIRPVAIEDLLRRDPVELDVSEVRRYVAHDVVLVTGAGGSIGSELCRQLAKHNPKRLVLAEQAENALWAIHRELEGAWPDVEVVPAIVDVCDRVRVEHLMLLHRPSVVFHAAAHKHVPMMEWNPGEAIKNNVIGTKTVADAALAAAVQRFVMISTDKAVNPTSVMGATKRIAERYVQHVATTSDRAYVSVRFGNVLGSTGSVVPVFEEQIARGGPVTVTHPEMVRYFMTIPEASQLVLQAGAIGHGGEIFVLDMGEPVKVVDLASDLIRLSGLEPDVDIAIEFTGLRPGEKMYEELSLSEEHADRTAHPKIWIGRAAEPDWPTADQDFEDLAAAAENMTRQDVHGVLRRFVPEFSPPSVPPSVLDTATFPARTEAARGVAMDETPTAGREDG